MSSAGADASAVLADGLRCMRVHHHPFDWAEGSLPDGAADRLADRFPTHGLVRFTRSTGSKRYANESWVVVDERTGADDTARLATPWHEFVRAVQDPAYRVALGGTIGTDLDGTRVECRLVRHCSGGYLGPHTDRADKLATQLWYFSVRPWSADWGGQLQLLASEDPTDVVTSLLPESGRTVVFVRSESSWHAVQAVSRAAPHPRLSFLVHFYGARSSDD